MNYELRPFIESVESIIKSHRMDRPGRYRRWNRQDAGGERDLGLNPYGCADAANILYTIGRFPRNAEERRQWVEVLQDLQNADSGLFEEATHHPIHTTAHCIAALELFDAGPKHRVTDLLQYTDAEKMRDFLDGLDWKNNPWPQSHQGAGLYVSLVLTGEVGLEWQDAYFDWLENETDPETGFLRRGCVPAVTSTVNRGIFPSLAGTFHYMFNCEYGRRTLPFPEARIDSCIDIWEKKAFPALGNAIRFAEIDWVFCMTRSMRRTGHRYDEAMEALEDFAARYIPFLLSLEPEIHDNLNDLHALFGAMCCLAELQWALPGRLRTATPLRLVLDRRPFI